ncbi:helix-turn-helix domain-containing protein [Nocardioides carbamazepini]|uniref:helix-turn-helix domain-containing protein n=1 Tax=Nocardioides carbamazepini TaxID=2854259 RepID=UPI002149EFDE|nr:helix-turn-helix domain-containing protein [Nocardioides carbamazepini]MCR1784651.1 helix-turn-helix domain-containing protein [Nocardioides carbamazepini]
MTANDYAITSWTKLGGLIRDARKARALTQADLAQRAGVARSWLARVEAGHRGAELEPLLRLLRALELTLTLSSARPEQPDRATLQSTPAEVPPVPEKSASRPRTAPAKKPPTLKSFEAVPGSAGAALKNASAGRRAAWGLPAPREAQRD